MKKFILSLICILCLCGCTQKGIYKEGTYLGSVEFESYGKKYVTTATVYVDNNGNVKSCFIDSTYSKDDVATTKKTLGDNYGMKATSANMGNIENGAEWYEQVEVIEKKVVEEQNLDWVKWTDDTNTKLDGVSGVTISANTYIEAVSKALDQAK